MATLEREAEPGSFWLRSVRPPPMHLGTAQLAVVTNRGVASVAFSPERGSDRPAGSDDGTLRVWDARSGAGLPHLVRARWRL